MKRFLLAICTVCLIPLESWAIDEHGARRIAEDAAGCGPEKACETRARLEDNRWILIVSTIYGHSDSGEPIFKPGGWVGFTIEQDGTIVDRMPGR